MSFKATAMAAIATFAFLASAGTATAAAPHSQLMTCVESKLTEYPPVKRSARVTIKGVRYIRTTKTRKTVGSTVFYRNPRGICRGRIFSESREAYSYWTVTFAAVSSKKHRASGGVGKAYGPVASEPVHESSGGGA